MRESLSDAHFPKAKKIALVQDNLNTHKPASLYEAFPPDKARRLVERFEWHYTPKHGSWLNMAESELGILSSQCLDRRIAHRQKLEKEIAAWEADRNKYHTKANWQFTTDDARIKLNIYILLFSDDSDHSLMIACMGIFQSRVDLVPALLFLFRRI